jgi:hypothetical protein
MSHITSIGAGLFSDLSVATATVTPTISAYTLQAEFDALFDTAAELTRIKNVRTFPSMGTPPNIVKVPVYGQKQSQQIQGQSDAPSLDLTVNFVASDWASGSTLGTLVGDGLQHVFRFTLLNSEPVSVLGANAYASSALGIGVVPNSYYYWIGKIEALLVNPQLTDANTATISMSIQSKFFGAYTT